MINIKLFISLLTAVFLSIFFLSPNTSHAQKPMLGFSNHPWGTVASKMPKLGEFSQIKGNRIFFNNIDINSYSFYGFVPKNIKVQKLSFEFSAPENLSSIANYKANKEQLYFKGVFFDVEHDNLNAIKSYLKEFHGEPEAVKKKYTDGYFEHYIWQDGQTRIVLSVYREKCTMAISAKNPRN